MAILFAAGALCVYLASAGGRIVASDEHTMFLLTRSLVEERSFAIPEGNAERGPDGRLYAKAGLGQALASAPFYVLGRATAELLPEGLRGFVTRGATSLLSPVAGALAILALVLVLLEMGLGPRASLALAAVAAFGTPLWVYAKLYLAEALLASALTLELLGVIRLRHRGGAGAASLAAFGLGLALLTKYAIAPVALALFLPALPPLRRWRALVPAVLVAGSFVAAALLYNHARTGSWWGSGYGRQGTLDAFRTPLWVGLYGLVLSSGKGILWFAPVVFLAPAGFVAWWRQERALAAGVLLGVISTFLLYAGFEHWAGDGSWGPRYVVPLLPLLVAAVGARLAQPSPARRRLLWALVAVLGVTGAAVQLGGVAIYFGAQMREAGDYPYSRSLADPRFMNESHWNPYFSPILAHWRMLARNAREHAAGQRPRIEVREQAGRLGLDEAQAASLTHGFDVWAAYALYAGLPVVPVLAAWLALLVLAVPCFVWAFSEAALLQPAYTRADRDSESGEPPRYEPGDASDRQPWSMLGDG